MPRSERRGAVVSCDRTASAPHSCGRPPPPACPPDLSAPCRVLMPRGSRHPECHVLSERAINRTPGDAETLRDSRGTQLGPQLPDLRHVDTSGTTYYTIGTEAYKLRTVTRPLTTPPRTAPSNGGGGGSRFAGRGGGGGGGGGGDALSRRPILKRCSLRISIRIAAPGLAKITQPARTAPRDFHRVGQPGALGGAEKI